MLFQITERRGIRLGWLRRKRLSSKFSTPRISQFPSKMISLPLVLGIEGDSVTKEPQGSYAAQPVNPPLSSSSWDFRESISPLDVEVSSFDQLLHFLGRRQRKMGLSLIPRIC